MQPFPNTKKGFTLIELSIVLVIIGFIVGGVLVGRDLISAAGVRSQISQIERYQQAVAAFKGKYNCLPGDCSQASTYFPTLPAKFSGWWLVNGNDDGLLNNFTGSGNYSDRIAQEERMFWVHLYAAGLTDCCASSVSQNLIGVDFPSTKVGTAGIDAISIESQNGFFLGINIVYTPLGFPFYTSLINTSLGIFTPKQQQAFDSKIDDGKALSGNVYAAWLYGGDNAIHPVDNYYAGAYCIANTTPPEYNLTYGGAVCTPFIKIKL